VDVYAGRQSLKHSRTISTDTWFTAQRVSVVLEANQTVGNYWIRALYVLSMSFPESIRLSDSSQALLAVPLKTILTVSVFKKSIGDARYLAILQLTLA